MTLDYEAEIRIKDHDMMSNQSLEYLKGVVSFKKLALPFFNFKGIETILFPINPLSKIDK